MTLAGGPETLLNRAKALKEAGKTQLSLHPVDFVLDDPKTAGLKEAHVLKADRLQARADEDPSFIAQNIFTNGVRLELQAAGGGK